MFSLSVHSRCYFFSVYLVVVGSRTSRGGRRTSDVKGQDVGQGIKQDRKTKMCVLESSSVRQLQHECTVFH